MDTRTFMDQSRFWKKLTAHQNMVLSAQADIVAGFFEKWLKKNYNGKMSYMERNFDKRLDPRKLVQDSKSVISLSFNYYTKKKAVRSKFI